MKILLKYQNTEYDCGPTSFVNALSYLYHREEIPIELIKAIYKYTLDVKNKEGITGKGGTSRKNTKKLAEYFNKYSENNNFNIIAKQLSKKEVTLEEIQNSIKRGGVIVARCFQDVEHYVLITNIDDTNSYIFDPYYDEEEEYASDNMVTLILDKPYLYNRIVPIKRLFSEKNENFSLMKKNKRSIILIEKKCTNM